MIQRTKMKQDLVTQKRIHEHLTDEKDIISDDDIKNVKTDLSIVHGESNSVDNNSKDETTDEKKLADKTITGNTDPGIETSWNILAS